ncbi:glutamine synthetase 1, mitochondrial-like [Teleopsis dalmanni]|uniref:glutamine synthetase 1, mitochondrial-like n=1 Tax=Teleopsis dalmanni TaxID=139649 RepID=UPI0018CF31DC|nr:glutamine synthetase 1, mitochondrial-like [Teleopsis dalmanni]
MQNIGLRSTLNGFASCIVKHFLKISQSNQSYFLVRNASFLKHSPNVVLDKSIRNRFKNLPRKGDAYQATYLWIDGTGENLRLKDRVLKKPVKCPSELPSWQYDGSSTYQAAGEDSDTTLIPRAIYPDPFKTKKDIIVMCDTYSANGEPTQSNKRAACQCAYDECADQEPWFGIEQEYSMLDVTGHPFGWPQHGFPAPQGPYYCSVGADRAFGRDIVEAHISACLYVGIDFFGTNGEVKPAQWEFQIGPTEGIKAADDLWVSRYLLHRIAEIYGVVITFDPKPVLGPWNGAGAHTNVSTKAMREEGGMEEIVKAVKKLSKKQKRHIEAYDPKGGEDNKRRLLERLETSNIEKFSWGVANRGVSVRIPRSVEQNGKGYFEDRRPAANCDPYSVLNVLMRTCFLDE